MKEKLRIINYELRKTNYKSNCSCLIYQAGLFKIIFLLTLFFCFAFGNFFVLAQSQEAPKVEWEKTFGGSKNDMAYSIQQTNDGGYIVAGETNSFGAGGKDFYVIKLDADGNKIWDETFGGSDSDVANSISQTSDGGYIVAGMTASFGAGKSDFYVIKLDTSGNKIWSKTFGGKDDDEAYSIQQTSDSGYIVAGWTESFGAGNRDFYVLKLNKDGNKIWSKTFGGKNDDDARSIQQTSNGGYIAAGETISFGAGGGFI